MTNNKTIVYATCYYTGQTRTEVFASRELAEKFVKDMEWTSKIEVTIQEVKK